MKKCNIISFTLALVIAAGTAFAACSCAGNDKNKNVSDTGTAEVSETVFETEAPTPETEPETEFSEEYRVHVENEKAEKIARIQFEKAMEVIGWVRLANMPIDDSAPYTGELETDVDGNTESPDTMNDGDFYRVNDTVPRPELDGNAVTSLELLKKYIKALFARTIADHLIEEAEEYYTDIGGVLCRSIPEKELTDPLESLDAEYFLSKFTDSQFRYTIKVTTDEVDIDGKTVYEYYDFVFQNTGSGWFWTQFPKIETHEVEAETETEESDPYENEDGEVIG